MHLSEKRGVEFARDACERFLIKKYSEFNKEEPPASWIGLVLLRCIGLAVKMPPETFPSEEELTEIVADEQKERRLMERLSPFLPFAFALLDLENFTRDMDLFLQRMGTLRSKLSSIKEEELPLLSSCLDASGMELALKLQEQLGDVREELLHACAEKFVPKFDANALRDLLDRIDPPLMPLDKMLAEETAEAPTEEA